MTKQEEIREGIHNFQDKIQTIIDNYDSTLLIDDPCPHCQVTKDILAVVRDWAIKERQKLESKREWRKINKSKDITSIIILGAKIKAFQQVIDKAGYVAVEPLIGEDRELSEKAKSRKNTSSPFKYRLSPSGRSIRCLK